MCIMIREEVKVLSSGNSSWIYLSESRLKTLVFFFSVSCLFWMYLSKLVRCCCLKHGLTWLQRSVRLKFRISQTMAEKGNIACIQKRPINPLESVRSNGIRPAKYSAETLIETKFAGMEQLSNFSNVVNMNQTMYQMQCEREREGKSRISPEKPTERKRWPKFVGNLFAKSKC